MKRLPFLFLVAGLICLIWLIHNVGLPALLSNLRQIGWGIAVVIAAELMVDVLNTRGWWYTFPGEVRTVPFLSLYGIRQAGAAINAITPTAMVGGEAVKAILLKRYLPLSDGLASVIAAKLSLALGQALFVMVGLVVFLHRLLLPATVKVALIAVFLLTVLGCLLFLRLQRKGLFASLWRLTDRVGLPSSVLAGLREKATTIDEKLMSFYATHSIDFAVSVLFHFLAQGLGALQIFLLLVWLGVPAGLLTCLAVEALSLLIDGALFFVPGKVGVQEGGKVLIFIALGFTTATGLTVGIALRLNQIALILLGLVSLAVLNTAGSPVSDAVDERPPVPGG
jgi:uncharacterized membrane protein YbhN (UPF0104 family)